MILLLILTSCRQPESFDEILHIFDIIAGNEQTIESLEEQKIVLKEREKELSQLIIVEGIEDNTPVLNYIEEILESIENRMYIVEEQVGIMEMTMEELMVISELTEKIENQFVKEEFIRVHALHKERYKAFIDLSDSYLEMANREVRLYNMLKRDEQNLQDIESLIMIINQRSVTNSELKENLRQVSGQLNDAINRLARVLEML
jgi:hypothetical protein